MRDLSPGAASPLGELRRLPMVPNSHPLSSHVRGYLTGRLEGVRDGAPSAVFTLGASC